MQQMEVAQARLREMIVGGAYAPGERLTEVEVAGVLAMSRTPVREALRGLVADGLVRSAGGRGVVVTALDAAALRDTYRVRAALEALTAELAAERQAAGLIAPAELTSLAEDAALAEEATAEGRLTEAVVFNRRFHTRIAALAANAPAQAVLDRLWDQIVVSTRASLDPPHRPAQVNGQHRELLAAITGGRAADAAAVARQHVLDTCG
ncbi:GntR family transcriptional regulator [Actinacidiphila bryophytorum]|uniref:DNA-binding transcriptional regulator, GntR family n=1 Tax=Actinacidiphila bryophytorum TaxID=1436133 RepID=A0A9W4H024_9ACTN|nr:GntR family transcriptional regulator [Actinacidiphila bryophytorum]MBM9434650.1 GntR family transcriptional regulator [Actinacidiphila bryophytorum]MBN6546190.1 GntR family transcriptional regulator [Actinacidiphila bryophytorum]CAG7628483.1 DNA-binding transcriptional regulator, GntR family [Actinacidiphila bryophytorum]